MDSGLRKRETGRHQNRFILGFDVFCQLHVWTQLKEGHYREAMAALPRDTLRGVNTDCCSRLALKGQPTEIGFHTCVGKTRSFSG